MQQNDTITLKDYTEQILRPSIINGIRQGKFDNVLLDRDVLSIISDEIFDAILERLKVLNGHPQTNNQA